MRICLEGTYGWFKWAGAGNSSELDFYQPIHVGEIAAYLPSVTRYLSLPTGYKFQITDEYEEI